MRPDQIKKLRENLGLTQNELALAFGVSRHTISQYEIGFRKPGPTAVVLLHTLEAMSRKRALEVITLLSSHSQKLKESDRTTAR